MVTDARSLPLLVRAAAQLLAVAVVVAADSGDDGPQRQVLVMRHCVRSTSPDVGETGTRFDEKVDFTARALPGYGVPEKWCTPAGLQVLEGSGAYLAESVFSRMKEGMEVEVVADTTPRNVDSAAAVMRGFGTFPAKVRYSPALFAPTKPDVGNPICKVSLSRAMLVEEVRTRLAGVRMPSNITEDLQELEGLIGVGRAGPLAALAGPSVSETGKLSGSPNVLAAFGQDMLYAYASGLSYLDPTPDQLYRFIAWTHWVRSVENYNTQTAVKGAALLYAIEEDLMREKPGVTIYDGHDTNLDELAVLLDVPGWSAPPYVGGSVMPTPPGSGLLFERKGKSGSVSVSFLYPVFNGTDGKPSSSGALRQSLVLNTGSLEEFRQLVASGLQRFPSAKDCFKPVDAEAHRSLVT